MNKNFADDALRGLLGRRVPAWARYALVLLATAVFAVFAYHARYAKIDEFTGFRAEELIRFTTVVLAALYALTAAVALHIGRRLNFGAQALFCVVIGAILLAKVSLFDYVSDDYDIFLSGWIYSYSQMGIKEGLGSYIGSDYTPPYLYLLLLISRVKNYPWQYLVKIVSLAFEALMAYAVAKLAGLKVRGDAGRVVLFCLTLMLPTVVFNGAYWGQCDVIYTSLCLLALYHALQKRSAWSMTLFGVALSFKLQTVFFLPTLLPLWLRKDIKLRHLALIPAAYMAMMIPAFWGGKSLHHVLTSTMDNGMLYALFGSMALALGRAMRVVVCLMLCLNRTHITREGTLLACLLVLGGVPFFLPKMHERYTFGADVLALVIAAYRPKRMALPLLFGLASYICYTGGLPGDAIFDLKWATLFQGAAVALPAAALYKSLHEEKTEAVLTEVKA